mmetsp:Transcript_5227/g.21528  ORF Transcript_5227/g.21528 Transcript_5227/m.21528 type:complete len:366 (+) Transcript_5227:198-1295(+)
MRASSGASFGGDRPRKRAPPPYARTASLLLASATTAILLSVLVGILSRVAVASLAIEARVLPKVDRTLRTELLACVEDRVLSDQQQFRRRWQRGLRRTEAELRGLRAHVKRLNRYVKRFFVPQLNFIKPTERAAKRYYKAVDAVASKLQGDLIDRAYPSSCARKYQGVGERRVRARRGRFGNKRHANRYPPSTSLRWEPSRDYDKAYESLRRKLESVRRTSTRFLLAAVAGMAACTVIAAAAALSAGGIIVKCIKTAFANRYRLLNSSSDAVVPAYIIGGRLFVDRASVDKDDSAEPLARKSSARADRPLRRRHDAELLESGGLRPVLEEVDGEDDDDDDEAPVGGASVASSSAAAAFQGEQKLL